MQLGATDCLSGPAAKTYLNEELFLANGIAIHWVDYSGYSEYPQMHEPFTHAVSILDLLPNMDIHGAHKKMLFSKK